jgi:hypothetical protein
MEPEPLIHLIYASVGTKEFAEQDLAAILRVARHKNEALGVTGMLLFADGNFFQVLEGEPAVVDGLYERIGQDPRHEKLVKIIREPIARRSFADWTMGYSAISKYDVAKIVGANDFFGARSCFVELDGGRAKRLLEAFAAGRWRVKLRGASGPSRGAAGHVASR